MSAPLFAPLFAALGVPDDLCARLDAARITTPFPIQSAVIPDALAGRDVAGRAPTGSGKTLAFGLPLVARLAPARRRYPTALVLAPTRELAAQITAELSPFARAHGHQATAIYGGVGYGPQRKALDAGAELVVACPGRLEDLLASGHVVLDDVATVVVDEADRMADMGFMPAVRRIVERTRPGRQVLLFSATFDGAVATLASRLQRDPVRHEIGAQRPDLSTMRHLFWHLAPTERAATTAATIEALGSTIVFCRTRHGADRLVKQLQRLGTTAAAIHGGRSQSQRDRALRSFARREVRSLVATDVAARGVHVSGVDAVVHYDPPADTATYIHRSGRTARAGATGVVVSLIDPATTQAAKRLQRSTGIDAAVTPVRLHDLIAPNTRREHRPAVSSITTAGSRRSTTDTASISPPRRRPVSSAGHGRRSRPADRGADHRRHSATTETASTHPPSRPRRGRRS
jgi:superfamily II DNA/RNA helicase